MTNPSPRAAGLSPTLRQLMIGVLAAAPLVAGSGWLFRRGFLGETGDVVWLNVALIAASWPVPVWAALLLLLDRPGPIRGWTIARALAGWGLVAAAPFLLVDLASLATSGRATIVFPLLPILGLVCLWSSARSLRSVRPGRCPRCGRGGIIAVAATFEGRTIRRDRGWCAGCGAGYGRVKRGEWGACDAGSS